jgi:hypothetical protein
VSKTKPIIVTVADEKLAAIDGLAEQLRAQGMTISQVLPTIGVISGSVSAARLAALRKVAGVLSVEVETQAVLPPPEDPQ